LSVAGFPRNIENVDHQFEVPYDVLVFAVGAINNTFNTPGVEENAFFLKVGLHRL
jgi:NADH dehydrogenase FAD-containing subunit